jgi:hypothetical protein
LLQAQGGIVHQDTLLQLTRKVWIYLQGRCRLKAMGKVD